MSHYKQRLESHILEVLTDLLERETRDPRVAGVAVTAVELNEDSSVATVFYMGGGENAYKGLRKAASFLRGEVGRFLKMRTAPELRFRQDDSLDRFNRIDSLLRETGDVEPAAPAPDPGTEPPGDES